MGESGRGTRTLAYITGERERVIGGEALLLYEQEVKKREALCVDIAKALKCDVVQLKNGDYLLVESR